MLKPKEMAFVSAYIASDTVTAAAEASGVSISTATRYLSRGDVREAIEAAQREQLEGVANYLKGMLASCAHILYDIASDDGVSPAVRIQAIQTIFSNARALNEQMDIVERLDALEEAVEARTGR